MPLLIIILAVAILLTLIVWLRFNAFIALIMVAIGVGLVQGLAFDTVIKSINAGIGSTLGELATILGFGAMLGGIVASSGAAQTITDRMTEFFGRRYLPWGMMLTGLVVGIPLFYSVGFIILVPLIFVVARRTALPLLYVGLPLIAALSVTHGFLPPHPAPTAITTIYGADLGLVMLYGLILAIPTIILAGPGFARAFRHVHDRIPLEERGLITTEVADPPPLGISLLVALSPVLLLAGAGVVFLLVEEGSPAGRVADLVGEPAVALLISVLLAVFTLGVRGGKTVGQVMDGLVTPVQGIAMVLLIIAGGGALKQVLIDSGISEYIVDLLSGWNVSPLVLAWCIAAALRIALGSATVAALTAAGIALPLIERTGVSPELLVLATGAGSLTFSQVNDTGFWLFKEYFGLTIGETFRSWTLMETMVSIIGLIGCLIMEPLV